MKKIRIFVILFVFTVIFISYTFSQNVSRNIERWEYNELSYSVSIEDMNKLGSEGWELVVYNTDRVKYIFKRKIL